MANTIHPTNRYVGERLRHARQLRKLNQKELGERITNPISFQQVQKYERGTNRISVVLLHEFADVLQLPLAFFLPDQDKECPLPLSKRELKLLSQFNTLNAGAQDALLALLNNMKRGE